MERRAGGPRDSTPESFEPARDALVEAFAETHDPQLTDALDQLLDVKADYADPDPSAWDPDQIAELLLGAYPAHVALPDEEVPAVVPALSAYLRFLADERIVDADDARGLANGVDHLAGPFADAMADEDRWGMSKRIFAAVAPDGIESQAQLDAVMQRFNALPDAERDRILGPSIGRGAGSPPLPPLPALPAVRLAPPDVIDRAARASVQLTRVQRLVEFVGTSRPLTDAGNLKLADGKELVTILGTDDRVDPVAGGQTFRTRSSTELTEVDYTFELAVATRILDTTATRVRRGPNAERFEADPSRAWYALLLVTLRSCGPITHRHRDDRYGWWWYAGDLDNFLTPILLDLYADQDSAQVPDIAAAGWDELLTTYDLDDVPAAKLDFQRGMFEQALRYGLGQLALLGVLRVDDDTVELTPLGQWGMQRIASAITDAPVLGELAHLDAAGLLAAAADLPAERAAAEIDDWLDTRGPASAGELAAAATGADDTGLALAYRALLRRGPDADSAVAAWENDARTRPYALLWRHEAHGEDLAAAADPEDFVSLLHAAIVVDGEPAATPLARPAAGPHGLRAMLDTAWRVRRDETETVLSALGAHLPDKADAKAARKALFRHRSSR